MPKVIRIASQPKKKDPQKGKRLQIQANRMFMSGDTGPDYLKLRRAAEYHLGFWEWQTKGPKFGITKKSKKGLYPKNCVSVKCPYLPVGSKRCKSPDNVCP